MKRHTQKDPDRLIEIETDLSFFEIDMNELDKECATHPKTYHEYAMQMPQARKKLGEAEAELKLVKAEVDKAIRSDPEEYDLASKPTESSIATTIFLQKEYKQAQRNVIDAQYNVDMLDAMLRSLDRKGSMIDNAVKLHGQDYFSPIRMDEKNTKMIDGQRSDHVAKMCRKKDKK